MNKPEITWVVYWDNPSYRCEIDPEYNPIEPCVTGTSQISSYPCTSKAQADRIADSLKSLDCAWIKVVEVVPDTRSARERLLAIVGRDQ